ARRSARRSSLAPSYGGGSWSRRRGVLGPFPMSGWRDTVSPALLREGSHGMGDRARRGRAAALVAGRQVAERLAAPGPAQGPDVAAVAGQDPGGEAGVGPGGGGRDRGAGDAAPGPAGLPDRHISPAQAAARPRRAVAATPTWTRLTWLPCVHTRSSRALAA